MSVIKEGDVKTPLQSVASTFEDLEVFQRAYRISLEVHRASLKFPEVERHVLGIKSAARANRSAGILPKVLASSEGQTPNLSAIF